MKNLTLVIIMFLIANCSLPPGAALSGVSGKPGPTSTPSSVQMADLPDYGQAPELMNQIWLNVDHPLHLADLHGKVVAIEMWTLGCINCQHVIPVLRDWYSEYQQQGFVIIGNHYPEFEYEANLDHLKQAVKQYQIEYPVAQDNNGATWNAYQNSYWPALYLVDKRGHIRYRQIGEGAYETTRAAIQKLLAESYP